MLDFSKIVLPLDLEEPSLPPLHQAAALARHFHSSLLLLHVVRPLSSLGLHQFGHGDLLTAAVKHAEEKLDAIILPELRGIPAARMVVKGDPGRSIVQIANDQNAKLIVMGGFGLGALASVLLGSATSKVLDGAHCPVWTGAHLPESVANLAMRNVLCAVEFGHRDHFATTLAADLALAFGARLTLAHVTPSVEMYGPGGSYDLPGFKNAVISGAAAELTKLQKDTGVRAETYIGSGSVPKILRQAARDTKADLLVIGRPVSINRLGANSFAIIRESPVPVLSV